MTGEIPKAHSFSSYETSTFTRRAQQHHRENLSQHTSQCSCSSDKTQCHIPEPNHNSETASKSATKHHDQQNQWNKQHQLSSASMMHTPMRLAERKFATRFCKVTGPHLPNVTLRLHHSIISSSFGRKLNLSQHAQNRPIPNAKKRTNSFISRSLSSNGSCSVHREIALQHRWIHGFARSEHVVTLASRRRSYNVLQP